LYNPVPGEFTILPNQKVRPFRVSCLDGSDSIHLVVSFEIFPETDQLKYNKLHLDLFRAKNPDVEGFSLEFTLRNLYPEQWNRVQKIISLARKSDRETFNLLIQNNGKFTHLIRNVKISRY
jgi:hypothetical protein